MEPKWKHGILSQPQLINISRHILRKCYKCACTNKNIWLKWISRHALFVRCLHGPVVCRTRLEFPLIRVSLDLPLHPPSIVPHRRVQGALRGVDQPLHIPLDSFHLLIALCQLPVSFTPDLPVQLKLLWLIQGLEIRKTNSINQSDEVHLG